MKTSVENDEISGISVSPLHFLNNIILYKSCLENVYDCFSLDVQIFLLLSEHSLN